MLPHKLRPGPIRTPRQISWAIPTCSARITHVSPSSALPVRRCPGSCSLRSRRTPRESLLPNRPFPMNAAGLLQPAMQGPDRTYSPAVLPSITPRTTSSCHCTDTCRALCLPPCKTLSGNPAHKSFPRRRESSRVRMMLGSRLRGNDASIAWVPACAGMTQVSRGDTPLRHFPKCTTLQLRWLAR